MRRSLVPLARDAALLEREVRKVAARIRGTCRRTPHDKAGVHRQPRRADARQRAPRPRGGPGREGRPLDIASGYFNLAGFLQAADVVESRPAFRLLLGAEPEGLAAQADGRPLGVEARRGLRTSSASSPPSVTPFRSRAGR